LFSVSADGVGAVVGFYRLRRLIQVQVPDHVPEATKHDDL
jgi:hypothetical protein